MGAVPIVQTLVRAALIGVLSLGAGLTHQALKGKAVTRLDQVPAPAAPAPMIANPAPAPDPAPVTTPVTTPVPVAAQADPNHLDLAQAKAFFDTGMVHIVDARNADEFARGHINGAIHLPPEAFFGGRLPDALAVMMRAWPVIVYCGGGSCDASELVALRLREQGYTRAQVFTEGFPAWLKAGYPVTRQEDAP